MGRKQSLENNTVIVDSAYELIRTEGFPAFSTRRLAATLNVSKTTAYNYLPNKEEILARVVERGTRIFHMTLGERLIERDYDVTDLFDSLLVAAETLYFFILENGDVFKLMHRGYINYFEGGSAGLDRIGYLKPVFEHFFPRFESPEFADFLTPDKLNRYYYFSILVFEFSILELNRVKKIGEEAFMAQVRETWTLFAGRDIPAWFAR